MYRKNATIVVHKMMTVVVVMVVVVLEPSTGAHGRGSGGVGRWVAVVDDRIAKMVAVFSLPPHRVVIFFVFRDASITKLLVFLGATQKGGETETQYPRTYVCVRACALARAPVCTCVCLEAEPSKEH